MKSSVLIVALGIAGLLGFAGPSSANEAMTIPLMFREFLLKDVNVIPPATDLPKELAAFSKTWEGEWPFHTPFLLIVEKIDSRSATVVYTVMPNVRSGTYGLSKRLPAQVVVRKNKKPRLEFTSAAGARIIAILNNEGLLDLIYDGREMMRATAHCNGNGSGGSE